MSWLYSSPSEMSSSDDDQDYTLEDLESKYEYMLERIEFWEAKKRLRRMALLLVERPASAAPVEPAAPQVAGQALRPMEQWPVKMANQLITPWEKLSDDDRRYLEEPNPLIWL